MPDGPVCPMCLEPGIHASVNECLTALRAAVDRLRKMRARAVDKSVRDLDRFVPSYVE